MTTTTNSSPPVRPAAAQPAGSTSTARSTAAPTAASTSSPAECPQRSLTSLNPSRSRTTAHAGPCTRARWWSTPRRFSRPVSGSRRPRRSDAASSTSTRASARTVAATLSSTGAAPGSSGVGRSASTRPTTSGWATKTTTATTGEPVRDGRTCPDRVIEGCSAAAVHRPVATPLSTGTAPATSSRGLCCTTLATVPRSTRCDETGAPGRERTSQAIMASSAEPRPALAAATEPSQTPEAERALTTAT